ncbi:MAG: HAD family hydrolase, partial [Anaerolineae bacterium]|nr:HAD family hydrolase [Anaerolineae bacterium]
MPEKSLDLTRIRGICFDVDGTLSDTDDVWTQDLAGLLRPVSFMFKGRNPNPMARRVVMAIESPGNAVFTALDVLHLDRFVNRLMLRLKNRLGGGKPPHFQVIPGVPAMLSKLAARYPLAVVSMRDEDNTLRFLNTFSLRSHFGWIASSQTTVYTKPFPDPILWVAQQMGCSQSELLMVGDTT